MMDALPLVFHPTVGRDVLGAPHRSKGTVQMATKTKTITVQVDERLAAEIEGTTVHNWRTTTFASGKRRVYATFESVKTVGGMR